MIVPLTKVIVVASPRIPPRAARAAWAGCAQICLSCLLEAGRYGDMIELLACVRMKWWHWHRFGAEALARQGAWDAAIAYADGCRAPEGYGDRQIDRFCEDVITRFLDAHLGK